MTPRILAVFLFLASHAQAQNNPGPDWPTTTPAAAGWSAEPIAAARSFSAAIHSSAVVIVQHGQVIDSWGDIAHRTELHSMRKSLLSALIGIAVSEGAIHLDTTLADLRIDDTPPLSELEKTATIRQLLEARSGIYHPALYETAGMQRARPPRYSHPPGTFYYYNNWDFNALGSIYETAARTSIFQSFADRIATPLAMQDYRPSDGRYVTGADSTHPAYPFHMSARDLARFGLLYLHDGSWNGRPVVPAAWVRESTTPVPGSVTRIGTGYGYLWWTGLDGNAATIMGLPKGAYWADGARGQFIAIDPADDMVVVHQTDGHTVQNRQFGHLMWLIRTAAHAPDLGADPAPNP